MGINNPVPLAVVDDTGKVVGALHRERVIGELFKQEAPE